MSFLAPLVGLKGGEERGSNKFLLLGSGSLLLSCSSPFRSWLTLSPQSPPLLPPNPALFFFPSRTVRVSLYECCRVSLKSTDDGSCGPGRGAADTPLPHPEQLLILRNRIISAKVAALFRSREQTVNKPRELAVQERSRGHATQNCLSLILIADAHVDQETNPDAVIDPGLASAPAPSSPGSQSLAVSAVRL